LIAPQPVLFVIWALELLGLAWDAPLIAAAGTGLMVLYVVLCLPRLRRGTLILCGLLVAATIGLAAGYDGWRVIVPAIDRATIFSAFFGTIMILRATADRRPEIDRARTLFGGLDDARKSSAFLVAGHLIGALLVVGVMAVLAPIQSRDAGDAERRRAAEATLRGMCLAPLWSPFWIAMAVSYQHLPDVELWRIMGLGLGLAALGLIAAQIVYAPNIGPRSVWRAVSGLSPIVRPVALCAAVITLLNAVTPLSSLEAVVVATPVLCALALAGGGARQMVEAMRGLQDGLGRVSDEIVLISVALVLGEVIQHAVGVAGVGDWIAAQGLAPAALIAIVIGGMTLAALCGIHQIVSITVMLALIAPLPAGPSDLVLMESALVGWAMASMIGISAVSVSVAGAMFRVPMERLVLGPNLWFAALFGALATAVLSAVQWLEHFWLT